MERMYSSALVLSFIVGICGFQDPSNDDYYELGKGRPKTGCSLEDAIEYITIPDLEDIIVRVALREGINPTSLLAKLHQKMRNKQRARNDDYFNSLEDVAVNELIDFPLDLPPFSNNVPSSLVLESLFELPSHSRVNAENGSPSYLSVLKSMKLHHPPPPSIPRSSIPGMFSGGDRPPKIPIPNISPYPHLPPPMLPPPDIIVRFNAGDNKLEVSEVRVVATPMMTVVEALRQADTQYQKAIGLSSNDYIIHFGHSPWAGCFVVSRFNDIAMKEGLMWKLTILEKNGKIAYDGFCVPTGKEIRIKPGMQISLTYTEVE